MPPASYQQFMQMSQPCLIFAHLSSSLLLNGNVLPIHASTHFLSSATKITHSEPTGGYLTTTIATASAVVQPSLDSRAQPVATGHAIPLTSTQFNSPLVAGMQTHRLQASNTFRKVMVEYVTFLTSDYVVPPFYIY